MSRQTNPVDRIVHTFVIIMVAFLTLGMGILGKRYRQISLNPPMTSQLQ